MLKLNDNNSNFEFIMDINETNFAKSLVEKLNNNKIINYLFLNVDKKIIQTSKPSGVNNYIKLSNEKSKKYTCKDIIDLVHVAYTKTFQADLCGNLSLDETNIFSLLNKQQIFFYLNNKDNNFKLFDYLMKNYENGIDKILYDVVIDDGLMNKYSSKYDNNILFGVTHDLKYLLNDFNLIKNVFLGEYSEKIINTFSEDDKTQIKEFLVTRFNSLVSMYHYTTDVPGDYTDNYYDILNIWNKFNSQNDKDKIYISNYCIFNYSNDEYNYFNDQLIISDVMCNMPFEEYINYLYKIFSNEQKYLIILKQDYINDLNNFILLLRKSYNIALEKGDYTSLKKFKKEYKFLLTNINKLKERL